MDLTKKNITNLTEYTSLSRDVMTKYSQLKITLNVSTIVTLNKLKSFEIEHFNKYYKCGAAFQAFEKMLLIPPSKTWDEHSKKLASLFKFWFNKLQHQMMQYNAAWWNFLNQLLYFVKELRNKGAIINCKLVEVLGEDFLQLTINTKLNLNQRQATLHCFNVCCAELSKESRLALRKKFEEYFTKLAHMMPSWGDFRLQFSTMETLLRWLLNRKEHSVREEVATIWFPHNLYSRMAVKIFLDRDWKNFFKDARDFLNAQNENNSSIISLICKRINIGKTEVITATDKKHWIDFNIDNKCISMMLNLKLLEVLKIANAVFDALVIDARNARSVKLTRNGALIKIEITLVEPLSQCSEKINNEREISIYMNAINAEKVDDSLKKIFGNNYETSAEGIRCSSNAAGDCSQIENSEDSRQSFVNTRHRKRSRVAAASLGRTLKSPSTTSTTSLLYLKEKLSEYPGCLAASNEEYSGICAKPLLPRVTEESEENLCVATPRMKPRCNAVFSRNLNVREPVDKATVSKSGSISLVLATTIDSFEATVPYDTLDGFPEGLELNTVNYLAHLQQNKSESASDLRSELIENTPSVEPIPGPREEVKDSNNNKLCERIEADVLECVNNLLERVCVDFEIISNLMNRDEFTKNLLNEAGLQTTDPGVHRSNDTQKAKKKRAKPIQITFPKTKEKGNQRKGQRRQKKAESEAAGKLSIAYETDVPFESPNSKVLGPITRRRRKLYSPKDDLTFEGAAGEDQTKTGGDHPRTPTTSKTPYREIQEMRATHRKLAKRKCILEKEILSPRSKRLNDDFDMLLQTDCEDVKIKKSNNKKDISVYNFTDSDDSDFKDDVNLEKKPSMPLRKSNASANFLETKTRKRRQKNISQEALIDEKMRKSAADLNTSLIMEQPIETCESVEPVVVVKPLVEEENHSTKKSKIVRSRATKKKIKSKNVPKNGRSAKRKISKPNVINLSRDREESISPGLKYEFQVAVRKSHDSIVDLEKINIIEKAEKEDSFERSDGAFKSIKTKAFIEHVPLVHSPTRSIRKTRGSSSRGQPQDSDSLQTIKNNNVKPTTPQSKIYLIKTSEDQSIQRFPRISVERMSEEDIKEWLSPRANSVPGSPPSVATNSKPPPKPETSHTARPSDGDNSISLSPRRENLAKNCTPQKRKSLIVPFKYSKKSNNQKDHSKKEESCVDNTERDVGRKSSSIRAVSLKIGRSINRRVLKTPDSKESFTEDIPVKRQATSRSTSSSDSDKRRSTKRGHKIPISRNVSSSREEESECSKIECSNAEVIHNWLDQSQREGDTDESDAVRINIFGDIFKDVQKKIDRDLAKIHNNARSSLEHIQRGVVKQIEEARLRRQALYTETARDIFTEIGKTLEAKFSDLEAKCERVDDELLENISRNSTQVLSEIAKCQVDLVPYLDGRPKM